MAGALARPSALREVQAAGRDRISKYTIRRPPDRRPNRPGCQLSRRPKVQRYSRPDPLAHPDAEQPPGYNTPGPRSWRLADRKAEPHPADLCTRPGISE